MLPLLGLYADVYKERNGRNADAYAFIEPIKDRLFPATFDYVHRDLNGVEDLRAGFGMEETTLQFLRANRRRRRVGGSRRPLRRRLAASKPTQASRTHDNRPDDADGGPWPG